MKQLPKVIIPHVHGVQGPEEHLAYISQAEAHMLKMMTDGQSNKTPMGPQSFENLYGLASPQQTQSYYSAPQSSVGAHTTGSGGGYGVGGGGGTMPASSSGSGFSGSSSGGNSGSGSQTGYTGNAMGGGFGAQAFGKSTTPAASILQAILGGNSGGYNSSMAQALMGAGIGNGWRVGDGVVANGKMQDRIPQSQNQTNQAMMQPKDQSRIMPAGFMANYQAYQQPPGAMMTADQVPAVPGAVQDAQSTHMPFMLKNAQDLLANGYGQYPSGQGLVPPAPQVAAASDTGYPPGYNPNGPETPSTGLGASPAAGDQATTGPTMKYPVKPFNTDGILLGNPNGNRLALAADRFANMPIAKGSIVGRLLGGGNDNVAMNNSNQSNMMSGGGGGGSQSVAPAQTQQPQTQTDPMTGETYYIDPATGKRVTVKAGTQTASAGKMPWYYPKYENGPSNLPTGLGGYIG